MSDTTGLKPTNIQLTKAEIQSGFDRVRWAEELIRQLPEDHDGRNSWLLNYGSDELNTLHRTALDLKVGEHFYFNMFQDGGAKIKRVAENTYCLFGIPLYGGTEREEGTCFREGLREAIQEALSWT